MAFKIPESALIVVYTPALDVLLLERADRPGFWQSVTGGREPEDTDILATARRELFEETGLSEGVLTDWRVTNRYAMMPQWLPRYAPGVTQNTEHVFGFLLPERRAVALAPDEHTAQLWLPWQDAMTKVFSPTNRDAIGQLPRRLA